MHDASCGMRGLAADCEPAFQVAIEGNAIDQEIMDTRGRFARKGKRYPLVDEAATDRDRIGSVRLCAVAFRNCGCDAALRPCGRCALAERCR